MTRRQLLLASALLALAPSLPDSVSWTVAGAQTRALIVTGLGAEDKYRRQFIALGEQLTNALTGRFGIPTDNIAWLGEDSTSRSKTYKGRSTSQAISREFDRLATSAKRGDQIVFVLIGHGSGTGEDTKFNIPGPDITARDFNILLARFDAQRVAFLNLTTASGDAIGVLSSPNRIVVTSTKSAYERNESQFARFFVEALDKPGVADVDKDGRVSLLEAYRYGVTETRRSYENDERLVTEHAQLDDDGNGKGTDLPDGRGAGDGLLARRFFLDVGAVESRVAASDPRFARLYADKFAIEDKIDALKQRKAAMKVDVYYTELEVLLIGLARVAREIRQVEGR